MSRKPVDAQKVASILEAARPGDLSIVEALRPLYVDDCHFEDPLQSLRGLDAFLSMNRKFLKSARVLKFSVHDKVESPDAIFLSWTLDYGARWMPQMKFEGVTRIKLRDGKISEHRDYWDLVEGAFTTVPKFLDLYKKLNARVMGGRTALVS